jgi:hypothetical protein
MFPKTLLAICLQFKDIKFLKCLLKDLGKYSQDKRKPESKKCRLFLIHKDQLKDNLLFPVGIQFSKKKGLWKSLFIIAKDG